MIDILDDYCRLKGYQYCRIDEHERRKTYCSNGCIAPIPKNSSSCFPRAGGLGINLQTADVVILTLRLESQMDLKPWTVHIVSVKKASSRFRFISKGLRKSSNVQRKTLPGCSCHQTGVGTAEQGPSKMTRLWFVRCRWYKAKVTSSMRC